jgi:hypothetical protein
MSRRSNSGADGCMRFKKEGQTCKVKKKGANVELDLKTRAVLQLPHLNLEWCSCWDGGEQEHQVYEISTTPCEHGLFFFSKEHGLCWTSCGPVGACVLYIGPSF